MRHNCKKDGHMWDSVDDSETAFVCLACNAVKMEDIVEADDVD